MTGARDLRQAIQQLREAALDTLYPPQCIGCGLVGVWVCEPCRVALPHNDASICSRCGRAQVAPITRCADCAPFPPALRQLRSAFRYEGAIREGLHKLKYHGVRALAAPLVDLAWPHFERLGWAPDAIVPVPLHPKRQRERGFNQAAAIADALGARAGLPVAAGLLRKVRHTPSQVKVGSRVDRRRNVAGAFVAAPAPGRRLLLVDDLATTGSTLAAAANALHVAGSGEIRAYTVAREG